MSNLNRHVRSDKIKWAITAVVLFLVITAIVGVCLQVFGKGKVKPSEWFTKSETKVEQVVDGDKSAEEEKKNADELEQSGSSAIFSLNSYAEITTCSANPTYDVLPKNVKLLEVGDNLSGATIIIDFSRLSFETVPFIRTTGNYFFQLRSYAEQAFGLAFDPTGNASSVGMLDPVVIFCETYIDDYKSYPLTGFVLTENTGKIITCELGTSFIYLLTEPNKYTVKFDSNGGNEVESIVVTEGETVTFPDVEYIGHTLKGWYLPNGNKYTGQPITEDTTLLAVWEIQTFVITFFVGDEKVGELTVDYGSSFKAAVEYAEKKSLNITSVYTVIDTEIKDYSDLAVTEDLIVKCEKKTVLEKAKSYFQNNWVTVLISSVSLVVLLVCIFAVLGKLLRKRR